MVVYDWQYASVALAFAGVYLILVLLTILQYAIMACNIKNWARMQGDEMVWVSKETVGSREPSLKGYLAVKTKDSANS
jgi:hypothetical protein